MLIPSLISTTSHLLANSSVEFNKYFTSPFVIYSALIGNPSSGKSTSLNSFSRTIEQIEHHNQVQLEDSLLTNNATFDTCVDLLKRNKRLLVLNNQASEFLHYLDNLECAAKRGMFLSLHSGSYLKHMFNLSLNSLPAFFIRKLREERHSAENGLIMSRFLLCAPRPNFDISVNMMLETKSPEISLVCLMYAINEIATKNEIVFQFSADAESEYIKLDNQFYEVLKLAFRVDEFIMGMFGKGPTFLLRLAGIVSSLNKTVELLEDAPDANQLELTKRFTDYVRANLVENTSYLEQFRIIDLQAICQASKLLNYFNAHKLVLADYVLNLNQEATNLHESVCKYLKNKKKVKMTLRK